MKYIEFDESRPMDLVLLGRVAIDFNPAYNDQVKEEFKPLKKVHMFEKYTLWLMTDKTAPIAGQVSPSLSPDGQDNITSSRSTRKIG